MNTTDNDLQDFFAEIRAQDEKMAPPPFTRLPRRAQQRRLWLPVLTAAASVLLVLAFWNGMYTEPAQEDSAEVLIISLGASEVTSSESLLFAPESVYSWEAPSSSLIADF
ncbi:MAG: hypothetical protein AAF840_12220 [Bacteroidota bacterium]